MLARHAEDLFWIGRYIERAEDTARLLDVTHQSALEGGARSSEELWGELLEVLYLDDVFTGDVEPSEVTRFLVSDVDHSGSLVSVLGDARSNARASREWLSAEFWESINSLHLELDGADLNAQLDQSPYDVFRRVKAGCQSLTGVADSSLPRSEGYRFLILGGALERAMITARVTKVWQRRLGGFAGPAAYPEWVKLLKSLSAYEAYLRDFRAAMHADRVLEFLLQDPQFPRSTFYCLNLAESQLAMISDETHGRASKRAVGRVRAELEFAEPTTLDEPGLAAFLDHIEQSMQELPLVVEEEFFRLAADAALHSYEVF
jgi:uncharacterized alpha-E superfamily protein